MSNLSLRLFGGFYAAFNGEPIAFETDKVRALLAYLAVEADRPHSRSALATLLWADYPEANARTTLRHVLHLLRTSLANLSEATSDTPYLLITRQTLQFNPAAPVGFDVAQFMALLQACENHPHANPAQCDACAARLRQAVDLYRGDFLSEFAVHDSTPFEEWRRLKQEQWHIQALDALHTLAAYAEAKGQFEQARRYALRQVELEPWREEAHQQLMRNLALSGQRTAALAQFAACRRILDDELGVTPSPQTLALYEQIRDHADREAGSNALDFGIDPAKAVAQRLPTPLTRFVGRQAELQALGERMAHARLLTLTGPGGCGKTRLAIELATTIKRSFMDGVYMVDLASLSDPALLPQMVATALGTALDQSGPSNAQDGEAVAAFIQNKQILLLLDNCEHVIAACASWARTWLSQCPHLQILATSRESMNIEGEQVWPVAALAVPATTPSALPSPAALLTFDAIQLFVERAREMKPNFALTSANASAVVQICQRLEGLPLAIELASARINLLTPTEIATRLSQRLDLIDTGRNADRNGGRASSPRHQTLRAAIDWSYDLLSEPEQRLFRRLAVFSGGFTLDAAEAVAEVPDTLNLLARLMDKSLIVAEVIDEQSRYRMLEVLREFAQHKLDEVDDQPESATAQTAVRRAIHSSHIRYFMQLAERAGIGVENDGEAIWLRPDLDNFRIAIDRSLGMGDFESGIRLIGALSWYWWMRGYLSSHQGPIERYLISRRQADPRPPAPLDVSARFEVAAGMALAMWGKLAAARTYLQQVAFDSIKASTAEPALVGIALRILATIAIRSMDDTAANDFIQRSIEIWRSLGAMWHVGWLLAYQGDLALIHGDAAQAWAAYEASSQLPISPGARAYPLRQMAYLALEQGQLSKAAALGRESLSINVEIGDQQGVAACLACTAAISIAAAQKLPEGARFQALRRAAQLLGVVSTLLAQIHSQLLHRDQYAFENSLQALRDAAGNTGDAQAYQTALAEGRVMVAEQAISLALQDSGADAA